MLKPGQVPFTSSMTSEVGPDNFRLSRPKITRDLFQLGDERHFFFSEIHIAFPIRCQWNRWNSPLRISWDKSRPRRKSVPKHSAFIFSPREEIRKPSPFRFHNVPSSDNAPTQEGKCSSPASVAHGPNRC